MGNNNKYIIGLGNYAKNDDGIGLRIIEYIVENNLDNGFDAIEIGNDGISLLTYFNDSTEKILIVDCALMGKTPGDYLVFPYDSIETKKEVGHISTHEGDIVKLVELGVELEYPIPEIMILAIEPESLEMDMKLSECLESKIKLYVDSAIDTIKA